MKLVSATHNDKLEVKNSVITFEIYSLNDIGFKNEIPENRNIIENSKIKCYC